MPVSYTCKECWDYGVWNCYRIEADGQVIDGFIKPKDEQAFLDRHPEAEFTGVQLCTCYEQKVKASAMAFVKLPKHREHCTFEWFDALEDRKQDGKREARIVAEQMAGGGEPHSLLLHGATGLGKSSLAACIVKGRIAAGMLCRWIDFNEFLNECYNAQQRSFRREKSTTLDDDGPDNPFQFVSDIARTPFLVIDDFGDISRQKPVTDYQRDQAYAVIRYRYEHELPTVVTTNLDYERIVGQFGPRIAERLGEVYSWYSLEGINLRFERG